MAQLLIEQETLEKWQRTLDDPKLPKNACFNVSEEIYDFLQQAKRAEEKPKKQLNHDGLSFNEIVAGNVYEVFRVGGVKYAPLNGKKAKCIQKNRTKVKIILMEDAGPFKVNHSFTIPPSCLREVQ